MTVFLIICLLITALFLLLLLSRATFAIEYMGEDVVMYARVFFIKFKIYPERKKWFFKSMSRRRARRIKEDLEAEAERKRAKKEKKRLKKLEKKKQQKGKKGLKSPAELLDILTLVTALVKQLTGKFLKHLRIKLTKIKIKIGTGDAAATAIAYGAVTQSINVLFPLLEEVKNFSFPKNKDIDVSADFTAEESEMDIHFFISIRVWRLLHFGAASFFELIKYFFRSQERKERRGGVRPNINLSKKQKSSPSDKGIKKGI